MDARKRKYKSTDLTTIDLEKLDDKERQWDLLKTIYGEINSNYRNLSEIRFKLLGLVPAVSVIAWATLFENMDIDNLSMVIPGIIISSLGLLVTYGVRVHDKRNDELYDDLLSRGRKIEEELGVHTAVFKGRLDANKQDWFGEINHGRSLNIIYSSVYVGWLLSILWYVINLVNLCHKL